MFLCRRFGPAAFVPPAAQRLNAADDVGRSVQEPDGDVITREDKTASANVSACAMQSRLRLRLRLQRRPQFQFQFQLSLDMGTAGPSRHTSSRRPPPLLSRRRRKACPRLYLPPPLRSPSLSLPSSPPPPSPLDASCDLDRGPSVPDPPLGPPGWLRPPTASPAPVRPKRQSVNTDTPSSAAARGASAPLQHKQCRAEHSRRGDPDILHAATQRSRQGVGRRTKRRSAVALGALWRLECAPCGKDTLPQSAEGLQSVYISFRPVSGGLSRGLLALRWTPRVEEGVRGWITFTHCSLCSGESLLEGRRTCLPGGLLFPLLLFFLPDNSRKFSRKQEAQRQSQSPSPSPSPSRTKAKPKLNQS